MHWCIDVQNKYSSDTDAWHVAHIMLISTGISFTLYSIFHEISPRHYNGVIMGAMASQITSLTIVYSAVYSSDDHRKHQSSASLAFLRGIHQRPVNIPHKWAVTRKMFSFDDVIMVLYCFVLLRLYCELLVNSRDWFTYNQQHYFTGTEMFGNFLRWQWSNPQIFGRNLLVTKHDTAQQSVNREGSCTVNAADINQGNVKVI